MSPNKNHQGHLKRPTKNKQTHITHLQIIWKRLPEVQFVAYSMDFPSCFPRLARIMLSNDVCEQLCVISVRGYGKRQVWMVCWRDLMVIYTLLVVSNMFYFHPGSLGK